MGYCTYTQDTMAGLGRAGLRVLLQCEKDGRIRLPLAVPVPPTFTMSWHTGLPGQGVVYNSGRCGPELCIHPPIVYKERTDAKRST